MGRLLLQPGPGAVRGGPHGPGPRRGPGPHHLQPRLRSDPARARGAPLRAVLGGRWPGALRHRPDPRAPAPARADLRASGRPGTAAAGQWCRGLLRAARGLSQGHRAHHLAASAGPAGGGPVRPPGSSPCHRAAELRREHRPGRLEPPGPARVGGADLPGTGRPCRHVLRRVRGVPRDDRARAVPSGAAAARAQRLALPRPVDHRRLLRPGRMRADHRRLPGPALGRGRPRGTCRPWPCGAPGHPRGRDVWPCVGGFTGVPGGGRIVRRGVRRCGLRWCRRRATA
ncbi:hypothetical protein ACFFX0_08890 [Citricoccus parietis]|uniref:Uncharacterized protein n=1 Tax=Citricoccus parietis TaxID=592307 RepID=A0ABV5FXE9_9MICC